MPNTDLPANPFFANAVHELRTPIQTIIGTLDLFGDTNLNSEQTEYLHQIKFSSDILLALVNDLLDASKIQAGKLKFENVSTSPLYILESTLDLICIEAHNKGLDITTYCADDVPFAVLTDSTRIQQVLLNLVKNAVKFTSKGYVSVTLSKKDNNLLFQIIDTGIGVPEEKKQLIFNEFSQADASTTRKYGGTGLGLSICRNIVNLLHGQIGVEDNPEGGSIFWFTIPIVETNEIPEKYDVMPSLTIAKDLHILVVDDCKTALYSTAYKLKKLGLNNIEVTNSGQVALSLLKDAVKKNNPFDLAFIDMTMPVMDGWRLASEINADRTINDIKLLLLVPEGQMRNDAKMKLLDWFNGYVYKPIKKRLLIEALNSVFKEDIDLESVEKVQDLVAEENANAIQCNILVAEDHPINQKLLKTFLLSFGCTVYTANNGKEVLSQVAEHNDIDIIFMDIQMPEMNGIDATVELRKSGFEGIIVACTANSDEGDFALYREKGMNDALVKPFKKQTVKSFLDKWMPVINISDEEPKELQSEQTTQSQINADSDIWNYEDFLDTVSFDYELAEQLIVQFVEQTRLYLLNAKKAIAIYNFQSTQLIGHFLKGSAATVSAFGLSAIAKQIEEDSKNCDAEGVRNQINNFTMMFATFEYFVKSILTEWENKK